MQAVMLGVRHHRQVADRVVGRVEVRVVHRPHVRIEEGQGCDVSGPDSTDEGVYVEPVAVRIGDKAVIRDAVTLRGVDVWVCRKPADFAVPGLGQASGALL